MIWKEKLREIVANNLDVKNVVLVGHHPILTLRDKEKMKKAMVPLTKDGINFINEIYNNFDIELVVVRFLLDKPLPSLISIDFLSIPLAINHDLNRFAAIDVSHEFAATFNNTSLVKLWLSEFDKLSSIYKGADFME